MGRQRNTPQMKGKEEVSERMLNEIEASQLSGIEFKALVIRELNELTQNYQKLQGNYNELSANYIDIKKGNRNYQQEPRGIEEYNFGTEEQSRKKQRQAR